MKVRRYVADNVSDAMAQVKAELGDDAVILHSRTIRQGGFFGLFGKKVIEVTAALEDETPIANPGNSFIPAIESAPRRQREAYSAYLGAHTASATSPTTRQGTLSVGDKDENYTPEHLSDFLDRFRDHIEGEEVVTSRSTPVAPIAEGKLVSTSTERSSTPSSAPVARELARTEMAHDFIAQPSRDFEGEGLALQEETEREQLSDIKQELIQTQALLKQVVEQREEEKGSSPAEMPRFARRLWKQLVTGDVDADLATELINGALALSRAETEQELEELVQRRILEAMQQACFVSATVSKPEIVALVGPTGVGKTTTLAKLAAHEALVEKKRVGLITIDTYRIAAVEQLKTYARILDLQVEVVFTPQELSHILTQMQDCDIIFIDTAGRSHKNAMQMSELRAFFEAAKPTRSYLVLSLTTKFSDMMEIIAQYDPLRLDTLIFTKLDETASFGNLFNITILLQKHIAYITNGQSVPEDISPADPMQLSELIMGKRSHA